jgi:hypothetical protein
MTSISPYYALEIDRADGLQVAVALGTTTAA